MAVYLEGLSKAVIRVAQATVTEQHYLHAPVDARCSVEGYGVWASGTDRYIGYLLFGRPEATKVKGWYEGKTYWNVLNLARVWFSPQVQPGGEYYSPNHLPGFTDRRGEFRSTLVSTAIGKALDRVGYDYLMQRPPCFLDEPYDIEWCLSYCDTRFHKGTIYRAAGFELYRENKRGIQTWRKPLRPLLPGERAMVINESLTNERSKRYRTERQLTGAQLTMF